MSIGRYDPPDVIADPAEETVPGTSFRALDTCGGTSAERAV